MKNILLFIGLVFTVYVGAQSLPNVPGYTNIFQKYQWYGVKPPPDTVWSKYGLATVGDSLYLGNGTRWFNVSRGSSSLYTGSQSVLKTGTNFTLINDLATPDTFYVYGTDSAAVRGWHPSQPSQLTNPTDGDNVKLRFLNGRAFFVNETPSPSTCNNVADIPVSYVSGLTYAYGTGPYTINCVGYNIAVGGTITLDDGDADPGEFRFDVIYADASGIHVLKGTNSSGGVGDIPQVDIATQVALLTVRIDEAGTTPTGPAATTVYDENIEWTGSTGGTITAAFNYATNPQNGSLSTRITAAANNAYFQYTNGTTVSKATFTNLQIWIRNNNTFNANRNWIVRLYNTNTQVGNNVNVTAWGYSKTLLNTWQLVSIPMSAFGGADLFNRVRILNTGTGGTVNVQFDNIQLQQGIVVTQPPAAATKQVFFANVADMRAYTGTPDIVGITLGYYTSGDGGGAKYSWNASSTAADNGGTIIGTAAVGRWNMIIENHTVNVKQFGAKGDGATDDLPAFKAAYNALPVFYNAFNQQSKGIMRLPVVDSQYIWSDSFLITHQFAMIADEGSMPHYSTVKILTAANKSGIFINGEVGGRGRGVILKNFQLWPTGSNTDTTKDGIEFNSIVDFDNLNVQGYGGNGIYGNVSVAGNANGSHIENCFTQGNGKNGYEFQGSDVNQIHFDHNQGQYNGRWNLYNNSFLGITSVSGLTAGGGSRTGYTSDVIVSRSGNYYKSMYPNQNKDPLTNSDIWENLGATTEIPASAAAWSSGTSYKSGGPIYNSGAAQANVFINPYTEGDGGSSLDESGNTIVIGGIGYRFWDNSGIQLIGNEGWLHLASGAGVRVPIYAPSDAANVTTTSLGSQFGLEFINKVVADESVNSKVQFKMSKADSMLFVFSSNIDNVPRMMFTGRPLRHPGFKIAQAQVSGLPIIGKTGLGFLSVNSASAPSGSDDIGMFSMGSSYPADEGLQFRKGFVVLNTDISANDTLMWVANTLTNGGVSGDWDRILKSGGGGGGGSDSPDLINGTATAPVTANMDNNSMNWSNISTMLFKSSTYSDGLFKIDGAGVVEIGDFDGDVNGANIRISDPAELITIEATNGAVYAADYSANYTSRSLVDKAYVDAAVAGGGGGGTPGGSSGDMQWNSSSSFAGGGLTWDNSSKILTWPGSGLQIRENVSNYTRMTVPTNVFQMLSNNAAFYNSGGTNGFGFDNSNRDLSLLDPTTEMRIASGTGGVGIGSAPATNEKFAVTTTVRFSKPFPVMTTSQRNAISSPAAGDGVYCSDCTASDASTGVVTIYNGSTWKNMW